MTSQITVLGMPLDSGRSRRVDMHGHDRYARRTRVAGQSLKDDEHFSQLLVLEDEEFRHMSRPRKCILTITKITSLYALRIINLAAHTCQQGPPAVLGLTKNKVKCMKAQTIYRNQ
jgi:hypothetical protein